METFHLHIKGQVQGVGFRPHVYKLAISRNLKGWVKNTSDGVNIKINTDETTARKFLLEVIENAPKQARIDSYSLNKTTDKTYQDFKIKKSHSIEFKKDVRISPDFGMCEKCRKELLTFSNRRFRYPFTTCTNCGPRFSIIQGLPYDRHLTTMEHFKFCSTCKKEYDNPQDRRFYSQTNSCPDCTITLQMTDASGHVLNLKQTEMITKTVNLIRLGKIVAIKGIGGYLLCCDAYNESVIKRLRKRKQRPDKPLALIYPSIEAMGKEVFVSEAEKEALLDTCAPIVILRKRPGKSKLALEAIAPQLNSLGMMLPYAPLLYLISYELEQPMVATSGNLSTSPIIYDDQVAQQELSKYADYILLHNREIVVGQDDSVIRFHEDQPVVLRRSRGLAPSYFGPLPKGIETGLMAMGAHIKGSIAIKHGDQVYISQYLGNLEGYEAQVNCEKQVKHMTQLLDFKPEKIFVDKHPGYFSSKLGLDIATDKGIECYTIPHHEAHFAAVLAENELLEYRDPVLGVIWDGTGLGNDEQIWGGEFFVYQDQKATRIHHLNYVPVLMGDKMAQQPRLSALAFSQVDLLKQKFTLTAWDLYYKSLPHSALKTSSMGRLFDAVASLLDIIDQVTFEGQAAMYLEEVAWQYKSKPASHYPVRLYDDVVDTKPIIDGVIADKKDKVPKEEIAWKFHYTLVKLIRKIADTNKIKHLAFSGGVFQNTLLIKLIRQYLLKDFKLYFHKALSPNDENISFGQIICHYIENRRNKQSKKLNLSKGKPPKSGCRKPLINEKSVKVSNLAVPVITQKKQYYVPSHSRKS